MISERPRPAWQRYNPRALRLAGIRDALMAEGSTMPRHDDARKAINRSVRALSTAIAVLIHTESA